MQKKVIQKMWLIHDALFFDHEKAKECEDGKDVAKVVYVGVDEGVELQQDGIPASYVGSWIYYDREKLEEEIKEYNKR